MNKQANSTHCFVCGTENPFGLHMSFYETGPGEVETHYSVPEHFQGYPGVTHGGIIAAMLDEVAGRVFMSGEPPRFMVTGTMNVRYRKPVPTGVELRLVGKAVKDNGRVARSQGFIYHPDGTLLAEAELVLVNVPQELMDRLEASQASWRVIPDDEESK